MHYIAKITVGAGWVDKYEERVKRGLPNVLVQSSKTAVYAFGIEAKNELAVREKLEAIVPELCIPATGVTFRVVASSHDYR